MSLNVRYNIETPIVDLRSLAEPIPKKHRMARGQVVERDPSTIIGVGLHQTSCIYGVAKYQIEAAARVADRHPEIWSLRQNDTTSIAKDLRALQIAAHVTVFLEPPGPPRIVLALPFRWWVNHGNALNPFTIGVEVEAKHPRFEPKDEWLLNLAQVQAIRDALLLVEKLGRAEGMPIEKIWGHCQSHGGKPADPGEAIWRAAVTSNTLRLEAEPDRTFKATSKKSKDGVEIPKRWR